MMANLLKYDLTCSDEEKCGKSYIVLVDPDETLEPTSCPFCGELSSEINEETKEAE